MLISITAYNHPQGKQNCTEPTKHSLVLKFTEASEVSHAFYLRNNVLLILPSKDTSHSILGSKCNFNNNIFSDILQEKITSFFPLKGFRWNNICVEIIVNMLN